MSLKQNVKDMFYNYASPYPYMSRIGWEPVADYGVNRYTLGNVFLNKLSGLANMNPYWQSELNHRMMMNESMYNPNFWEQMED